MRESGQKAGLDFETGMKMKGWMEEAGFVNVTEYRMRFLLGGWAKDEHLKKGIYSSTQPPGRQNERWRRVLMTLARIIVGQWNQLRVDIGIADFCARRFHNQLGVSAQVL